MIKWIKNLWAKSRTINVATVIAVLGVVEANFNLISQYFGDYHGLVYVAIAGLMAYMRTITTGPVR